MKKLFLLLLLMPSFSFAALGPDDNLIVLGERVGLVTKTTTLKELEDYFAKSGKPEQIKTHLDDIGRVDFIPACQTTIYPKTPKELTILWKIEDKYLSLNELIDDATQQKWNKKCSKIARSQPIRNIDITGYSGDDGMLVPFSYHTANGLRAMLSVTQMNELNGIPTRYDLFYSSAPEYTGLDFKGRKYGGYLFGDIQYWPDEGSSREVQEAEEKLIREILDKRLGDKNYKDDPTKPYLPKRFEDKIFLVYLTVYFERQDNAI